MTLTEHGKKLDQCLWVLEYFGTEEKRQYYKDNKTYLLWISESEQVVEANRLGY